MADWDEDSPQLRANLARVLSSIRKDAFGRAKPTIEAARTWHRDMMHRLDAPNSEYVGRYRGEPGIEHCEVRIGHDYCVRSNDVAASLIQFEQTLQDAVEALDQIIQPNQDISADQLAAVIELSAWVHSEWVRIHPFANGNGRTARMWANYIAMRYGLPPFVHLRPRPDGSYESVAAEAMQGRWQSTAQVFRQMYREVVRHRRR